VLIESVKPGSFADDIGVGNFQGGVIVSVDTAGKRNPIHTAQEFQTIVAGLHSGQDVALEIVNPQHPNEGNNYLAGTLP
jgi:S1-C subfamily serine protease